VKQLEKKERPEYILAEQEQGAGQVLKIVNKPRKDIANQENTKLNLIFEEVQQKPILAEGTKQKATLVAREARLILKTAEANRRRANQLAEKAKEGVSIAVERERQIAQNLFKARQKERDSEKRSQRATFEAEEALHKLREAEENKRMADFALEEAKQRMLIAEENRRIASFILDEAKRIEKYQAKEANQLVKPVAEEVIQQARIPVKSKDSNESGIMGKQSSFNDKVISPDNKDGLQGQLNLSISPGAQGSKILLLIFSLLSYSEIKIISIERNDDTGSRIELFVKNPIPLYQVLYDLPIVQRIAGKENELQITLRSDERLSSQ
jgi:hypothetical protein